ncbi:hypothetical protein [Agrobacterium tumefaciens]|uniref:hypothetical protein n=1 Tax=Agrobacterium tumefaciens TaxID=358 RepID=UPI001574BEA7|nr:hypothetical protein [Agrobacterium tumefaciens]WCJ63954.1 hypothetical protein G6M15_07135 [Agrobacterium tumefaciens]
MPQIIKKVSVRPSVHNSGRYGSVELATLSSDSYVNLITSERSLTISPSEAKQLRDQLLEIYPLEVAKPSKFKVGDKVAYQSIVGYGARGMAGRKGSIKEVLEKGWYNVTFTGGVFDNVIKVHEDYLVAQPVEQRAFQAGDKVRNKDGGTFSNGQRVVTLDRPCGAGSWWLKETNTRTSTAFLELVTPAASMPPAEPAMNTELGRFIVAKMDNGNYLPGTKPRVHTSAKSANEEATRLANDHGGTFHVLRASFEASRPVVVQPPVKTAKL